MTLATCGHLHGLWFGVLMVGCGLAMLALCWFFTWGSELGMSEDYVKPPFLKSALGMLGVFLLLAFSAGGVAIALTT